MNPEVGTTAGVADATDMGVVQRDETSRARLAAFQTHRRQQAQATHIRVAEFMQTHECLDLREAFVNARGK